MRPRSHWVWGPAALAAALLAPPALSGCAKQPAAPGPELAFGQKVRGKVTYKGRPVPYGCVLLYNPIRSLDPSTGKMTPLAMSRINKEGDYEFENAPAGHVVLCVAADPDLSLGDLMRPSSLGGPGVGGQPGDSHGGPHGGPPAPPGPHGGPGGAPAPPGAPGPHGGRASPEARALTDEQKALLKEVQEKYGAFARSRLHYQIEVGEQTINLELD